MPRPKRNISSWFAILATQGCGQNSITGLSDKPRHSTKSKTGMGGAIGNCLTGSTPKLVFVSLDPKAGVKKKKKKISLTHRLNPCYGLPSEFARVVLNSGCGLVDQGSGSRMIHLYSYRRIWLRCHRPSGFSQSNAPRPGQARPDH